MEPVFRCRICGQALRAHAGPLPCAYCGKEEEAELACPDGHYSCEACRVLGAPEAFKVIAVSRGIRDPYLLATLMMSHPSVPDHGDEHHVVPAMAVLGACISSGSVAATPAMLDSALRRTSDIPHGACGSRGGCGACESAGAAVSVATRATYRSDGPRAAALRASAGALRSVAEMGGPRCCKQSVYAAVGSAVAVLREAGACDAAAGPVQCPFHAWLSECKGPGCPYHPGHRRGDA